MLKTAKIIHLADIKEGFFKNSLNMLVIGFFDGVHKGHKEIIKRCIKSARNKGGKSIALTFDIPPVNFISGKKTKKLIIPFEEKIQVMSSLGIDYIVDVNFNKEFAGLDRENFCREILLGKINAKEIFIGENFKFGKDAKGDYLFLKDYLKNFNVKVYALKLFKINNIAVSSTIIRKFYEEGNIEKIKSFLGRYPEVKGIVQKGFSRGTKIGFPTANIAIDESYVIPKNGVYVGRIIIGDSKKSLQALINVGNNPTFNIQNSLIEIYILNFNKNIYNKKLTVRFLKYLRQEIKFDSEYDLIEQIKKDILITQEYFR
ncbi:MAG: bifunctional riboflavin kinase/FAD synthetase [Candidatus Humimicrobiaceae bacterium]